MDKLVLYKVADSFFIIFHSVLICFNLFGWIPKALRKWNLFSLMLTTFSWFILGIFYGFGYCFLTDWHWRVRDKLGYATDSNSYIHFLIAEVTGSSIDENLVDAGTVIFFFAACAISIYLTIRDKMQK